MMLAGRVPKPNRIPNRGEQSVLDELQANLIAPGQKSRWNPRVVGTITPRARSGWENNFALWGPTPEVDG
jgi:hypothetical protein